MEKVCLGKVVKLHGYMGQMKIITSYDKDFDIFKIEKMYDENDNEFSVVKIFKVDGGVVVKLDGIELESAKRRINTEFYIDRDLVKDKMLIEDLKGADVYFENDVNIGTIVDIQDYGSAEVFYMLSNEGKEILFPNVKGLIVSFNLAEKKLIVNEIRYKEVSNEN